MTSQKAMTLDNLYDQLRNQELDLSTFELIREYSRCWRSLSEETKSKRGGNQAQVESTLQLVKNSYGSLIDLLPNTLNTVAIVDGLSRDSIQHQELKDFIKRFRIPSQLHEQVKTVAIAVPNGALLGVVSLAVATYFTLAPIDPTGGPEQFRADILRTGSQVLLVQETDLRRLGIDQRWTEELGIEVLLIQKQSNLTFTLTPFSRPQSTTYPQIIQKPNTPDDICLILFTSGTSGTKKIVPFTLHSIVSSVAFVGESWALTSQDRCLNMMPLNHIGGLARNLFAPVLLGGSTICCSAFDPNLFWDLVEELGATWYYASPSMHSMILDESQNRQDSVKKSKIRMVCNAAGGLLPSLAIRLRNTFNCTVLPSYGMTECMPISTPPMDYKLERSGTSGISTGPEIAILDGSNSLVQPMAVGKVCVRGEPVFAGYLKDGKIDNSCFTQNGWFDTGDLGYLDSDKYLYITGRSKEVINRGGELISPFEIEEAIMTQSQTLGSSIYGRVSECLVFSVPHEVLQEVVGVAIVTAAGQHRPDLRQLQNAVKGPLHSTKWPVMVVFMDQLPKKNGKLCRVNLSQRMDWDPIYDELKSSERHYEATCPDPSAPINVSIDNKLCDYDPAQIEEAIDMISNGYLDVITKMNARTGYYDAIIAPKTASHKNQFDPEVVKSQLGESLPGYMVPARVTIHTPFPKDVSGRIEAGFAQAIFLRQLKHRRMTSEIGISAMESQICSLYATILDIPREDIQVNSNFFDLGGDSLRAGKLLSGIRKEHGVRVPIDKFFGAPTVKEMSDFIESNLAKMKAEETDSARTSSEFDMPEKMYSSSRTSQLMIHLLPLSVIVPLRKTLFWLIALQIWQYVLQDAEEMIEQPYMQALLLPIALFLTSLAMEITAPLIAISAKYAIIGKYKEGVYPMWSAYHTRWWLVQKTTQVFGLGMFRHFNWSRVLYFRIMGAKIGKNVTIEGGTELAEYDLLELEDDVELDRCIVRPFAAEKNTQMYLGKIVLGKNSSAGLKTIIAPGARVPANTHLGIQSSSWEIEDACEANQEKLGSRVPKPHWILHFLIVLPISWIVNLLQISPWILGLMVFKSLRPPVHHHSILQLINWFSAPTRIAFHFGARAGLSVLSPIITIFAAIFIKKILDKLFGKHQPCKNYQLRQVDKLRSAIMHELIPHGNISEITGLFGTHYEITSKIVRLLGGKVGERVYWPGHGPNIQNFDLIDIGDDVVFGSRSYIITSDGHGCDFVRISAGAMVADRVIITPGGIIGEQAVLGSGTLTRRNDMYAPNSVYIGSRTGGPVCLSMGITASMPSSPYSDDRPTSLWGEKTPSLASTPGLLSPVIGTSSSRASSTTLYDPFRPTTMSSKDTTTPFGRAFYYGEAPYKVWSLMFITCYCMLTNIFVSMYWGTPTILALSILANMFRNDEYLPLLHIFTLLPLFSVLVLGFTIFALIVCIAAKYAIIGKRRPGNYNWDVSSYNQRWQLYLTVERIRGPCFGGDSGALLSMLTGTAYLPLFYRLLGARIGNDCALFAGGTMTVAFTEPDLLTLGNRVSVDDASLVAHINSRGTFDLNPLFVGDGSVLRSGSRLLSGAKMGSDTVLLEHTLIMTGDDVEDGGICQGWPADAFAGDRVVVEEEEEREDHEAPVPRVSYRRSLSSLFRWNRRREYQSLPVIELTEAV